MNEDARIDRPRHRVVKTLAPGEPGSVDLARIYGDALVCVRHRTDARGKVRHVTVELLVRSTAIRPRSVKVAKLRLPRHDRELQRMVKLAGGQWDATERVWRLPSRVVGILGLRDRVVG